MISCIELQNQLDPAYEQTSQPGTGYIGYYKNSFADGTFWVAMLGGKPNGHLHGTVNPTDHTITGNNISYIYPDMVTALLGKFEDRRMKDAREATVLEIDCDENGLLYVSRYSAIEQASPSFYYKPPSNTSYGAGPQGVRDPYEQKWLELKDVNDPKMGEGIFAKKNLEEGVVVASYNGFLFGIGNGQLELYNRNCGMNLTRSDDERRHCMKYSIKLRAKNAKFNIPPEFDQSGMFLPSLGPKVNF